MASEGAHYRTTALIGCLAFSLVHKYVSALLCFFPERILSVVTELVHHAVSAKKEAFPSSPRGKQSKLLAFKLFGNMTRERPLKALCLRVIESRRVSL